MSAFLKLAWRNVWRNTRRSVLTIIAVAFGLALCIYTYAIAVGYHNQMIRDAIGVFAGHIQVHARGWDDNQTLEYLIEEPDKTIATVPVGDKRIVGLAPRVVTPGLVSRKLVAKGGGEDTSKEENTQFIMIVGADPAAELKITILADKIRRGKFISNDDPTGIIIGEDLAESLGVDVGDRVLLWTQDYYESLQAQFFFVRGIYRAGAFDLDGGYAIAPLATIQRFLNLDDMLTTVTVRLSDPQHLEDVSGEIDSALNPKVYEVLTWEEVMPELRQYVVFDDIGAYVFLAILIIVVAFGILNTQLMAVFERIKEFGTMLALGARPSQVAFTVFAECFFMTGVGVLIGNVLGFIAAYINTKVPINLSSEADLLAVFGIDPKMYAAITWPNFVICSGIIMGLALLMSLWPAMKAARFRPVEALRYV